MRSLLLVGLVALVSSPALAQQDFQTLFSTYVLTQEVPLSAEDASSARTGSFSSTAEPLAFHRNPALLAGVGRAGGAVAAFDGSGDFGLASLDTRNAALALGTSVEVAGQPLAFGIGFSRVSLDYGAIPVTSPEVGTDLGTSEASESAWSVAAGIGWTGPVEVDLGAGVHRRRAGFGEDVARGVTLDLGTALTLPVFGRSARGDVAPILDLSTGYAQRNLTVSNSLPDAWVGGDGPSNVRQGVLGYGVRAGLDIVLGAGRVPALVVDGRIESSADLDRIVGFDYSPQGVPARTELVRDALIGDASANTLLLGDGNGSVTGRRAVRVTLFDALSYTRGHFEGNGYFEGASTWGAGLDVGGALRLVGLASGDAALTRVSERLSMRANYGVTNVGDGFARSTFGGLTLGWRP